MKTLLRRPSFGGLLTTRNLSQEALRWIPGTVIHVTQLPVLASGKLDLAACLKLADGAPAAP
jgi:hypothetical protein